MEIQRNIKVVIGIYILFTIVSPVVNKIGKNEISIKDFEWLESKATSGQAITNTLEIENQGKIQDVYKQNLESDIKSRLQEKGYKVKQIKAEIKQDETYTIDSISCYIYSKETAREKQSETAINTVNIEITPQNENVKKAETLSQTEQKSIKSYLSGVYEVTEEKIIIEGM